MSPELEVYLQQQGVRQLAVERVLEMMIALAPDDLRNNLEANLRQIRIEGQTNLTEGKSDSIHANIIKILERGLTMDVGVPHGIRPVDDR
jgi:hypothetical protein